MPTITPHLEWSPTTNPGDTPVWEDISARLGERIAIGGGRTGELGSINPTVFEATGIDNRDRLFDLTYNPNALPTRRIRYYEVVDGVTYKLFSGYLTRKPQVFAYPEDSTAVLQAMDGWLVLQLAKLAPTVWQQQVRYTSVIRHWYRFGEGVGSVAADSIGTEHGTYSNVILGQPSLVDTDSSDSALHITNPAGYVALPSSVMTAADNWTVAFWLKATTATGGTILFRRFEAAGNSIVIGIDDTGKLYATVSGNRYTYTTNLLDGTRHFVVVSGLVVGMDVWVDGVVQTNPVPVVSAVVTPARGTSIGPWPGDALATAIDVHLDEAFVFDQATTGVLNPGYLWSAGATGFSGDRTDQRINRVLDWIGWPTGLPGRVVRFGYSTLEGLSSLSSAAQAIQDAIETENGLAYFDGDNVFQFWGRRVTLRENPGPRAGDPFATAMATFSDAPGAGAFAYEELDLEDEEIIWNEVSVSSQGQATQVVRDATSIARHYPRTLSRSIQSDNVGDLTGHGEYLLSLYKDPRVRIRSMRVTDTGGGAGVLAHILGRKQGHRLTVEYNPPGTASSTVVQQVRIENFQYVVEARGGAAERSVVWGLSLVLDWFVWDESTWDQTTRWAY